MAVPPSSLCWTEKRPFSVAARSSIATSDARRRSPLPLSATIVSRPPSGVSRISTEMRVGGPRRTAWFKRLADDLVQADLALLGEAFGVFDVDVDLHLVLETELLCELLDGSAEALVPEDDRLDVEGEVAEGADRLALLLERRNHDPARVVGPVRADRIHRGVEHQRDAGEVLHRAVVQEEGQPPAFVLLCGRDPVGEPRERLFADTRLREQASRSPVLPPPAAAARCRSATAPSSRRRPRRRAGR